LAKASWGRREHYGRSLAGPGFSPDRRGGGKGDGALAGRNQPTQKASVVMRVEKNEDLAILEKYPDYIFQLAGVEHLVMRQKIERPAHSAMAVERGVEIFLPLAELIDLEKEDRRLRREISELTQKMTQLEKKLSDQEFLAKAPSEVIEKRKQELASLIDKMEKLKEQLKDLEG